MLLFHNILPIAFLKPGFEIFHLWKWLIKKNQNQRAVMYKELPFAMGG